MAFLFTASIVTDLILIICIAELFVWLELRLFDFQGTDKTWKLRLIFALDFVRNYQVILALLEGL